MTTIELPAGLTGDALHRHLLTAAVDAMDDEARRVGNFLRVTLGLPIGTPVTNILLDIARQKMRAGEAGTMTPTYYCRYGQALADLATAEAGLAALDTEAAS